MGSFEVKVHMRRLSVVALCLGTIAALSLSGCGGGSGGGTSGNGSGGTVEPPITGSGLTGTVVSSATGKGVDGVIIAMGSFYTARTANGGKFSLNYDTTAAEMPIYFAVDTSEAGSAFPGTEFVTYRGQTYYPDQVDTPVEVLNGDTTNLGTITIKEVTEDTVPPPPYPSKDVLIYGRVVSQKTRAGIEGVVVTFGFTPTKTAKTGKKGYFVINAGRSVPVELFQGAAEPYTFGVNTSVAVGAYPSTLEVSLGGQAYPQDAIIVPQSILSLMDGVSIGTITVLDDESSGGGGNGGGENPPPPPSL